MADTPKQTAPTRRVSLTKTQRESQVGAELLSLCQAVTADGSFSDEEVSSLREWLQEHKGEDLPAISHLIPVVEKIVADGKITADECRELFVAVETVLPPDVREIAKTARRTAEQKERDRQRIEHALNMERQRDERERDTSIEHWDFMVAGVRHEGRPEIIDRHARAGEHAFLVRDPGNRYSRNAVQVRTTSGHQIGFVPEEDAAELALLLDGGHPYSAYIKKILTGGRYPIPVIVADVYRKDSNVTDLVQPQTHVPYIAARALGAGASRSKWWIIGGIVIVLAWIYLS